MPPVLGYWNIRAYAAPIRYLLECAGIKYEDKLYNYGTPPTFDRQDWLSEKFELGLDFPNLPYYIDENVKLTQSGVILRYLARKYKFNAKNEDDRLRVELLEAQVLDYRSQYVRICYDANFQSLKIDYLKELPDKMKLLSKFLGERNFAAGDYLTYVDFMLFEFIESQLYLVEDLLKDYPNLEQYRKCMMEVDALKKYFESERCIKYPFWGDTSHFGGRYSSK